MNEPIFDVGAYSTLPIMSLSSLTVLARTLITVAPRGLSALGKRAVARLEALARESQAAQAVRQRLLGQSGEETREIDVVADRSLAALRMRLMACALHTAEQDPDAPRAEELVTLLFPDGLEMVNLPYVEQLAAMEVLVARIAAEGLTADVDTICGPRYLAAVKNLLPRYRAMVQQGLQRVDEGENLQEHRRKLSAAITDYATKVAALYDPDDEQSGERLRASLRPIDALRAQLARRAGAGASEPKPAPTSPPPSPPDAG